LEIAQEALQVTCFDCVMCARLHAFSNASACSKYPEGIVKEACAMSQTAITSRHSSHAVLVRIRLWNPQRAIQRRAGNCDRGCCMMKMPMLADFCNAAVSKCFASTSLNISSVLAILWLLGLWTQSNKAFLICCNALCENQFTTPQKNERGCILYCSTADM
jgi:hypothetical protein